MNILLRDRLFSMSFFDTYLRIKIGGWSIVSYFFYVVVFFIYFFILDLLFDISTVMITIIAGLLAIITEYGIFEFLPQKRKEQEQEVQEREIAQAKCDLIQSSTTCMSCQQPLEDNIVCPHCEFDMSKYLKE